MKNQVKETINRFSAEGIPFLFVIDFDMKKPFAIPLDEIDSEEILFKVNGVSNYTEPEIGKSPELAFTAFPVSFDRYKKAFKLVQQNILHGNSFLLNLTMPSKLETNFNMIEIFHRSKAKYKLWFKDHFVVYSPEIFIKTDGRKISSFPMKGTIDASLPDAKNNLLNSEKETAEHYTIVDLIRNDLSMVAKNVKVDRFRYIDTIKTHKGELLQISSEISGELPVDYSIKLGDLLFSMLPAGSISGAPKPKTIEIIKEAEKYERGYYTGIFGIFDGKNIDSGVMIRYFEKTANGFVFKSGGGITAKSNCKEEYQELIDKIYIPL